MVAFELGKHNFEEWHCKNEGTFCFAADDVLHILKKVKPQRINNDGTIKTEGEILHLKVKGDEAKLVMDIQHSEYDRTWNVAFLYSERGTDVPTPKIELTTKFKIEKTMLTKIVEDAMLAGDYVRILASATDVIFESRSDEGVLGYRANVPKEKLLGLETKEPVKAAYNLGFLDNLLKNMPKNTALITFSFAKDMPAFLETGMYDKLSFYLAPRIEVD